MRRLLLALALVATLAGCGSAARGIPKDFHPETGAAFGSRDIWILGQGNELVRSTGGGAHFERMAFPPLPTQGNVPEIEFANSRVGYAFVRGGRLWATRDGGLTWRASGPRGLSDIAVAGRNVYAAYVKGRLDRSPVSVFEWRRLALPTRYQLLVSVAARGRDVWLLGSTRAIPSQDVTLSSTNDGMTFTRSRGPCIPGLGGTLVPAGGGVVWAVCPTGTMAGLSRSENDGRTFPFPHSLREPVSATEPPMTNGAQLYALSPHVAVLSPGADGRLYRTTDAGRHWDRVRQPWKLADEPDWLGFTTSELGYALVAGHLWSTTNAGVSWHKVAGIP